MRQSLQLKFSQQLTMTPQLQQAIKLLQLSSLDLQQEIIEQLYNNPLLETDEREPENENVEQKNNFTENDDVNFDNHDPESFTQALDMAEISDSSEDSTWSFEHSERLSSENSWNEVTNTASKSQSTNSEFNLDAIYQVTESLQDHLYWQLNLITLSDRDKDIAEAFIDSVDNNGFLTSELQEITAHLKDKTTDDPLQQDELIAVLRSSSKSSLKKGSPPDACKNSKFGNICFSFSKSSITSSQF